MSEILRDVSDPTLPSAMENNICAFFSNSTHAEIHDDPELLWWITDSHFSFSNMLLRANLAQETVDATIEAALVRARTRNVSLLWVVGPASQPSTLGQTLESYGFAPDDSPGMAVDLHAMHEGRPVSGLVIERVRDEEALRRWCHVFATGYGMPSEAGDGWLSMYTGMDFFASHFLRHYIGSIDGVPVASSSLCLAAGVAGIYCVATLPEFRQRGIGAAMTLAPLREALAQGYCVGTLQSSKLGLGVYSGIGFQEYCKIGLYEWSSAGEGAK